jgi:MFS family permease
MSMALWGTLFGALIGGMPTEKYGRKKVLIFVGILFAISSLGSAFAFNPYSFSFFRFIGGVGIGISSVVAPTYISEISTPTTRGKLGALYQFNIVFGILIAFLSNYFFQGVGGINDWRWMLGILFIPSLVYTIMVFNIPESPRWLILHSKNILLASTIMEVMKVENIDKEITNILNNRDNTKPTIFQIINDNIE